MTEKTIVECDWDTCSETYPHPEASACPPDWGVLTDANGRDLHLCPEHIHRAVRWCSGGISEGDLLDVKHNYIGQDFEEAHVHAGTHGMGISEVIDEPPRDFPEYDHDEDEAWGFHVYDHLHVYIFGQHKGEPLVVVDSDEFPTRVEIRDSENSFEILGGRGSKDGDTDRE